MTTSNKYFTAAGIILIIIVLMVTCQKSYGEEGKNSPTYSNFIILDTIPKQSYTYTLTFDRNKLFDNLDSLNSLSRFLGSQLSKDDWTQVFSVYNRVLFRIVGMGKLDSTQIKK